MGNTAKFALGDVVQVKGGMSEQGAITERFTNIDTDQVAYAVRTRLTDGGNALISQEALETAPKRQSRDSQLNAAGANVHDREKVPA